MTKCQAGRLLTLAYFLKTEVSPENFDMGHWGYKWVEIEGEVDINDLLDMELGQSGNQTVVKHLSCGTSACALGWATVVFPRVFRFDWNPQLPQRYSREAAIEFNSPAGWMMISGDCEEVINFFGISYDEADSLFYDDTDCPKKKARQIEELVSSHGYTYL